MFRLIPEMFNIKRNMKKIYSAIFEVDDDPDMSDKPSYAQSFLKNAAENRTVKIEAFLKEYAKEFHRIS